VIGGGPAGAAAAVWLARAGEPVELWERERGPAHKICGEFLSWEAQRHLARLGIDLEALGAPAIDRVRLFVGGREASARLGFRARSFTRRRLDGALLAAAEAAGAVVRRGVAARAVDADGRIASSHGALAPARLLVATGKHNLRGIGRDHAGTLDRQLGFKTYFRLRPEARAALVGHVEVMLFEGGYAGLQLVEGYAANLCFLVAPDRWHANGGDFGRLLADLGREAPHLARRLEGAAPLLERPLAISGVPYGFLHGPRTGDSFWRLGDQAAVIPSFTGDGMSIALHSGRLAAAAILRGETAATYHARLRQDARAAVRRATAMQRLAEAGQGARAAAIAARLPWLLSLAARLTRLAPAAVEAALASSDASPDACSSRTW
jgi:flavin-dependent dehydrogenase